MVELKEALRERGMATSWTKIELIKRLRDYNPKVWEEIAVKRRDAPRTTDLSGSEDARRPVEDDEVAEEAATGGEARALEERAGIAAFGAEERDHAMRMDLVLLRQEKELWEREQRLLQQELEMLRNSPATRSTSADGSVISVSGGVRNLKELLPEFDGTDNAFWRWRQQLQLLRRSYHLDDNSMRILISSRLKGRALSWFYSRAEYLLLSAEELLNEMEQMFDLRPGKLALRREFESRIWKGGESFGDYYYDKMILANRIPILANRIPISQRTRF